MKDTVKVLKRMMGNHLKADEYNALKEAIDCVKRVEKLEKVIKEMPLPDENNVFSEQYTEGYNDAVYGIGKYLKGV